MPRKAKKKTTKAAKKIKDLPAPRGDAKKVKGGLIAFTGYSAAANLQAANNLSLRSTPGDPCRF